LQSVYSGVRAFSWALTEVTIMHQAYSPETKRAHQRLSEQIELFINGGGNIEKVPSGVSGTSAVKPKNSWPSGRTAKA